MVQVTQFVQASPERVYAAFRDPQQLLAWLPPADMTAQMHRFDDDGYEMSLYYTDSNGQGKTSDNEDRVRVRIDRLDPPHRIEETALFDSPQEQFQGEMRMTTTIAAVAGGSEVTMTHQNLPPGLRTEDDEEGCRLSLQQLARFLHTNL
jgi:uncharacterized protein YndB with AHSA1/START domain